MDLCLKVARAKSNLLNILYNTRISWKTQFRIVDKTGVDELGINLYMYRCFHDRRVMEF